MDTLDLTIKRTVCAALVETDGNVSAAARGLGVPRRTLTRWLHNWRVGHAPVPVTPREPPLCFGSLRVTADRADPYKGECM